MKLNVKKQKVFEFLSKEENKSLSVKDLLNKMKTEGVEVSQASFFRYKSEYAQLQSSGELNFEKTQLTDNQHRSKTTNVENQVVKEKATPKEEEIDIWKYKVGGELFNKMGEDSKPPFSNKEELWEYIDEVDKREEEENKEEETPISKEEEKVDFNGSDLTNDEREELNILLDGFKTCRSVFDAMECCRHLDAFVQNKKKKIGKYVKAKVETLYKWQVLLFTNYGLDKRICFDE